MSETLDDCTDGLIRSIRLTSECERRSGREAMAYVLDRSAEEITRLTARIAELEKALKPFADCAKYLPQRPDDAIPDDVAAFDMGDGRFWTLQDTSFFEARALSASQDKGDESHV